MDVDSGTPEPPWSRLPTELYAHILSFFPPARDHADSSAKTLASCLCTNRHLRAVALHPGLWEPHYRARYTERVEENEARRAAETGGDWARMYAARRALDRAALVAVDEIRLHLCGRHLVARKIAQEYSFDVWDALEIEAQLPLPVYFRVGADEGREEGEEAPEVPHALPRRYWARAMLGVIARRYALGQWVRLYSSADETVSFEEALAGLSAFFDESPKKVSVWLNGLADQCRKQLVSAGVVLDPESTNYDLRALCVHIRTALREMGFKNAESVDFYNLLNQFPHGLMQQENRRTIPMSLVYIFVAVCQRLGIRASPTNFPGKVLCHIAPQNPEEREMIFDLCKDEPPFVFTSNDPALMLAEMGLPSDARIDFIRPCNISIMLHRAAANIIISVRWNQRRTMDAAVEKFTWCSYASFCVFLLQAQDNQILSHIMDSKPLDALAVLDDVLSPRLTSSARAGLSRHCTDLVDTEEEAARMMSMRSTHSVKYFVGMVVRHLWYDYVGCVIGWHPLCLAKEDLTPVIEVQRLRRGWDQPFYWVVTVDGAKRYVAEEDLEPIPVTREIARNMFEGRTIFGRYFDGVEVDEEQSRGRLLPTEELKTLYPEDNQAGAAWAAVGLSSAAKPSRRERPEPLGRT
ncbi:uncharacterized protein FIBRA_05249 [Fibroporia radiculosa]|uniref:Hemimethylated DNA-binding domain-containing protein n=1 Tax=Fibroporia radiculosa TaxID=599839 RepID=J4G8W7_9APHY|nr:uncharacterized protein FIBRA_05249 [Fibroporia radiculosa]CCM03128.1 predicted protein [Fibroporia radiculosa]